MIRAGVILLSDQGIAAIERVRGGLVYFTLPGGGSNRARPRRRPPARGLRGARLSL